MNGITHVCTVLLFLPLGLFAAAQNDASRSITPCASLQRGDALRPLIEYFTQHGVTLTCVELYGGVRQEWVVANPQDKNCVVGTSFVRFPQDATLERMDRAMSVYNRASLRNHAARIAMFYPGVQCDLPPAEREAALDRNRAVQQRLVDLFTRYVPAAR